jgi:hypothetical protein
MADPGQARAYAEWAVNGSITNAASNGATARTAPFAAFHRDYRPTVFYFSPTGADATGSSTATYRQLLVLNGGTSGTGTQVLASLNLVASLASWGTRAFTVNTSVTVASNSVIYFKQTTVGSGDHANCVMPAASIFGAVEFIG